VHSILAGNARQRANRTRAQAPALLRGLIFAPSGKAMTPTHTRTGGRLYRYYVSTDVLRGRGTDCPIRRVPAAEVERIVIDQIRALVRTPEIVVRVWRTAQAQGLTISEREVTAALTQLDELWDELFPAEQARLVQLMVERVDLDVDRVQVRLRTEGLHGVLAELSPPLIERKAA
jgi:hypothetical protein